MAETALDLRSRGEFMMQRMKGTGEGMSRAFQTKGP